jgi:hypothetical protein
MDDACQLYATPQGHLTFDLAGLHQHLEGEQPSLVSELTGMLQSAATRSWVGAFPRSMFVRQD